MKRLTAMVLALTLCVSLTGCMSRSERKELKATMDEANGYTTVSYSMDNGTELAEQTVIYDKNDVKVTVLGITGTDLRDGEIWYRVENNSKNTVTFSVESVTVNGWCCDWRTATTVKAGKMEKSSFTMSQSDSAWYTADVDTTVGSFTMNCTVEDFNDLDDEFTTEELKTTAYGTVAEIDLSAGQVVYDANDVKVVYLGSADYDEYICPLAFYIENNTDKQIEVSTYGSDEFNYITLADGRVVETNLWEYVSPRSRMLSTVYLYGDEICVSDSDWDEDWDEDNWDDYDGEDWDEDDWDDYDDEDTVDWSQLAPFTANLTISTVSTHWYEDEDEKTLDTVEITFGRELAAQETVPAEGDSSAPDEGAETQST